MQEELAGIKGNTLDWVKDRLRHLRVVTASLENNKLSRFFQNNVVGARVLRCPLQISSNTLTNFIVFVAKYLGISFGPFGTACEPW